MFTACLIWTCFISEIRSRILISPDTNRETTVIFRVLVHILEWALYRTRPVGLAPYPHLTGHTPYPRGHVADFLPASQHELKVLHTFTMFFVENANQIVLILHFYWKSIFFLLNFTHFIIIHILQTHVRDALKFDNLLKDALYRTYYKGRYYKILICINDEKLILSSF